MSTALITGASNGIGLELGRVFAANKCNLVLVARSGDKLKSLAEELSTEFKITVKVIAADLAKIDQVQYVYDSCKADNMAIDYLVNNAGFGDFGFFHASDWKKQDQMIDLNIKSLTLMCRLFLNDMVARRSGKIMNVASTAAFQPGPTMSVYYATKAYVLHFSEAIANELKGTGVNVTALCPGATESGFQAVAAMEESKLVKGRKLPTSAEVAVYGYNAMMKNKTVAIHGFLNSMVAMGYRFFPRNWVTQVTRMVQDK
jgi:short-subunit dehydrogenase